jgi:hypothetical protein
VEGAEQMDIVLGRIQEQAKAEIFRITQHALEEMDAEEITLAEILAAIANGQILEHYTEHKRGPCCLLYGQTYQKRPIHIVCTTAQPVLIIITVHVPLLPKWVNPTQRRKS